MTADLAGGGIARRNSGLREAAVHAFAPPYTKVALTTREKQHDAVPCVNVGCEEDVEARFGACEENCGLLSLPVNSNAGISARSVEELAAPIVLLLRT